MEEGASVPAQVTGIDLIDEDILTLSAEEPAKSQDEEDISVSVGACPECQFCGTRVDLEPALREVRHYVCRTCLTQRKDTHNYRCISQGHALQKYGLSLRDLKEYDAVLPTGKHRLAVKEVPNPRGFGNPMKLYYEFQILDISAQKYGSYERALHAIEQRQEEKFALRVTGAKLPEVPKPKRAARKGVASPSGGGAPEEEEEDIRGGTVRTDRIPKNVWVTAAQSILGGQDLPLPSHQPSRASRKRTALEAGVTQKRMRKNPTEQSTSPTTTASPPVVCAAHVFREPECIDPGASRYRKVCSRCGEAQEWEEI